MISGGQTGLDYGQYLKGFFLIQDRAHEQRMLDTFCSITCSETRGAFRRNMFGERLPTAMASGSAFDIRKKAQYRY